jgi:hypothetical protein
LFVRLNWFLLVGDRCCVAFFALGQPVELPLTHGDEDSTEHGDEDDQERPAEPQAAHGARLAGGVVRTASLGPARRAGTLVIHQ